MSLTAAQIQVRIDELQAARDSGVLRVKHGNDEVIYQTPESMDKTLAKLKADLAAALGTPPRPRVGYIEQRSKGFGPWRGNQVGFTDEEF
jgi:hypothetical protein